MTHHEVYLSAWMLRLHLVDMFKITRRCVDYAVRAFQQGNPDMIASARVGAFEIKFLHSETMVIANDLLVMGEMSREIDLRFVMSSIRICDSLRSIHNNAVEIASNTMRFWGNGGVMESTDFPWMGDGVNRLVECCEGAFIDESPEPAEIVLNTHRLEQELVSMFHSWYGTIERTERAQTKYAFAIARNLSRIVGLARETADALIFWLGTQHRESLGEIPLGPGLDEFTVRCARHAMRNLASRHRRSDR